MEKIKQEICANVEKYRELLNRVADYLHANPELGMAEKKASALLRSIAEEHGFLVEDAVADEFPTAFQAVKGNGPVHIGFLAEYDALPELGHGCGHNLIGAMSTVAAISCSEILGSRATVHLFGCPAEETLGSKVTMAEKGLFDGLDAALICHPSSENALGGTAYATHPLQVTFIGKPAHVADPDYHGINALDALVDFYTQLSAKEKTFRQPYILGKIITEGGKVPNIIPDRATMRMTVRSLDTDYLENVMLAGIKKLAQDVANEHGTELDMYHYEPLYKSLISDKKLIAYMQKNLQQLGIEDIKIYPDDYADGSTDVGSVSHVAPTLQPEIKIGDNIAAHTPEFALAAGSDYGKKQALLAVKALCMTAVDVVAEKVGN